MKVMNAYCPCCGNKLKQRIVETAQGVYAKCDWKPCGAEFEINWHNSQVGEKKYLERKEREEQQRTIKKLCFS